MAAWEDFDITFTQPKERVIHLKPGQVYITSRLLSRLFGISEHKARAFLKRLKASDLADINAHKIQGTIITIKNFDDYQFSHISPRTSSRTKTGDTGACFVSSQVFT